MNLAWKMGAKNLSQPLEAACIKWGIVGRDQCRFLAQLHVESAGFTRLEESLNYRPARLLAVFPKRNGMTPEIAARVCAQGQSAIAEQIYGGEWGRKNLGNTQPGDGWKFRGRGLIQLTGRSNYQRASLGCYGDIRLLDQPHLLALPTHAAETAAWFWTSRALNGVEDIAEVTRRINGGQMHLDERIAQTKRAYALLQSA